MLSRITAKNVGDVFLRHSVVVTSITGKSSIVSFRDSAHRIRRERWIADKVVDMNSHSDDVIDMATSIIWTISDWQCMIVSNTNHWKQQKMETNLYPVL